MNDNIEEKDVEKVKMDTARSFSNAILKAGKGARMYKNGCKRRVQKCASGSERSTAAGLRIRRKILRGKLIDLRSQHISVKLRHNRKDNPGPGTGKL
jgi:hypothetical protein